ncbi:DNA-directed DNA polymerase [Powellomyces hirtus]|uniref:DNA-directed DNA polymerase n=1 Tax=Powellomyces hirtus TaxID=109895 RepID=A0A507DLD9_9FUNG|nr:DNA-directed DNA polymerase [Powellomyces hirtus]
MTTCLLSVAQLEGAGANIQFVGGRCEIRTRRGALALSCDRQEGLYALGQPLDAAAQCHAVAASTTAATLETWHRRLGHLNCQSIQLMARKGLVQGMEAVGVLETAPCLTFALGKATKLPLPKECSSRASEVLELVHSDVCGPMRTLIIGGARYFILFIDNKSRAVFPYLLKTNPETLPSFRIFAAAAATETGCLLNVLQSDHGGEYLSKAFSNFTQSLGIRHQLSSVATPQQNGVANCMNRTLVEMARCLLLQAGLPYKFWAPRECWKSGTGLLAEATGLLAAAIAPGEDEPASLKAALKAPDARQWEQAAQTELNSLHANHTWDLVPLLAGCQPIKCKWVFKIKRAADGSLQRYKARLVANGFSK